MSTAKYFMRWITLLALCGVAIPGSAQMPLTIYSESGQRPFSYQDEQGMPRGRYVEGLMLVLGRMQGDPVRLQFAPWARALEEVKNGYAAALLGVYHRPLERPYLNYSKPIFVEEVAVHCNRTAAAQRMLNTYPEDFAGLIFGNQRDYLAPGPRFFEMVKAGRIKLVEGTEFPDLVKKMLVGEIDCVINPSPVIEEALTTLEQRGLPERMRATSRQIMIIGRETVHLGFSKRYEEQHPELADFRRRFDAAALEQPPGATTRERRR